ncbi:bola-like protein [Panus rudis PR-1116 ss-1]|nr:bola-like protein [Panus rudis PR-1116 ss-1]
MPIYTPDLETAIRNSIPVVHLEIVDQSNGCGENYAITIVSEAFEGKTTLARHRFINELLKKEIAQMHAFSQKTYTPKQWEAELQKRAASA